MHFFVFNKVSWDVKLLLYDLVQDRDNNFPILVPIMVAKILMAVVEGLKPFRIRVKGLSVRDAVHWIVDRENWAIVSDRSVLFIGEYPELCLVLLGYFLSTNNTNIELSIFISYVSNIQAKSALIWPDEKLEDPSIFARVAERFYI